MPTPLLLSVALLALQGRGHKGLPPGLAKKESGDLPPGLAKKGGLPPGLAKKYGRLPERPCIAVDPRRGDPAVFPGGGRRGLRKWLTGSLPVELGDLLRMPSAPPPVPLPKVGVDLHVVLFE